MRRALLLIAAALMLALGLAAARAEGATTVYLLRAASSEWIPAGGHVALSYTLRAAGGDGAKDVVITDPLVGEVARIDSLAPGESVTVTLRALMTEDCRSAPVAEYTAGGASRRAAAEPMTLLIEDAELAVESGADEEGRLSVTVTNEGRAPLRAVRLSEETLGDWGEAAAELLSGESVTVTYPAAPGRYRAVAEAYSMTGTPVKASADAVSVGFDAAAEAPADGGFGLSLAPAPDGLRATLTNGAGETLTDVTVEEAYTERKRVLALLPPGETTVFWPAFDTDAGEALVRVTSGNRLLAEAALDLTDCGWTVPAPLAGETAETGMPARSIALLSALGALGIAALGLAGLLITKRRTGRRRPAARVRVPAEKKGA